MKRNPSAAGMDAKQFSRIDEHLQRSYVEPGKIARLPDGRRPPRRARPPVVPRRRGSRASRAGRRGHHLAALLDDQPVTGVALMTLYEQGFFQLNDPVHRFIPSWRDQKVAVRDADGETRLVAPARPASGARRADAHGRHRLRTSERRPRPRRPWRERPPPLDAPSPVARRARRAARGRAAALPPGTHWLYSFGTDVCARLVEVISGRPFDEYLQTAVFDPLGMEDTGFFVPDPDVGRFAANYARNARKELVLIEDPVESPYRQKPSFLSVAADSSARRPTTSASVRCSPTAATTAAGSSVARPWSS